MPTEKPLRIGIIGCGRMGRLHGDHFASDARAEIVGLFDVQRTTAEALKSVSAPQSRVFASVSELIADSRPDAIVICTPTTSHFEQAIDAINAGCHLLCEKPLAESRDRIEQLIRHSEESDRVILLGYQRRHWSTYRTIRREVLSGRWGVVRAVTSHNVENWQQTIGGTWRDDPNINDGGFIGDAGSHKIDIVGYVTGLRAVEVFARCQNVGSRVPIVATVSAVLHGDVPLSIDFIGHAQYLGEDLHVHCEHADLMVRDRRAWIARNGVVGPLPNLEPDSVPALGFLDAILDDAPILAPFAAALPVFDFTSALLESARSGTSVIV